MTTPPEQTPAGRLWTCDGCEQTSLWTDEHQWYGSLKHMDEERWALIVVTCSEECRGLVQTRGLVPADAVLL